MRISLGFQELKCRFQALQYILKILLRHDIISCFTPFECKNSCYSPSTVGKLLVTVPLDANNLVLQSLQNEKCKEIKIEKGQTVIAMGCWPKLHSVEVSL
jgi:hypothetical protein